ncbi:MAG: ABC transporter permease [Bacteroidetes bacterium]|nr:ABC transporter permease [Bacteroidota bacterium]MBU1371470.1 ABC transporter permease [Bacteroidota bacterium]MBU1485700.1 ABC transporter permease [Bacteroidota bacterium]MBU1761732.1 ABC transporter permease [Bacteroidota bacterium]MBU2268953.1 ABC transporter permease [Bacteroidota bacterium]
MDSQQKSSWKKFKKNKLALSGLIFIILTTFISIVGYLVTPDDSPMANNMSLQLNIEKPGSTFTIIKIPKNPTPKKVGLIEKMFFGQPSLYDEIPVIKYHFLQQKLIYQEYVGGGQAGELHEILLEKFHTKDINQIKKYNITQKTFWLGTDIYGRDLLSRVIIGSRVSLMVGFMAVLISVLIGVTLGAIAGYFSGKIDAGISWLMNVLWSLPTLLLVIAISFALGKGFWQVFIAVGLSMWVEVARLVRGQVISIKNAQFVEAAKSLGYSNSRIIYKHILPNILGPILVVAASNFASAILLEAGLSFLGFGAQPPMPTWGGMIKEHYGYIIIDAAYLAIIPGLMIMLMVYAFNLVTIGLRDLFDVKSQNSNV